MKIKYKHQMCLMFFFSFGACVLFRGRSGNPEHKIEKKKKRQVNEISVYFVLKIKLRISSMI